MATIIDYIAWRGDLCFEQAPFNEVDNLILAELSYINFEADVPAGFDARVPLSSACDSFFKRHEGQALSMGLIVPDGILTLFKAAASSRRFENIQLAGFVSHIDLDSQEQFCAVTFLLEDGSAYIAFRGTDDTIVGWRENFNMALTWPVPAQADAAVYLNRAVQALPEDLYIRTGGHSKGGNLAVYAAATCDAGVRARVREVYSNDGPGFEGAFLQTPGYLEIRSRIRAIMPQNAVVGMLLEHDAEQILVKSNQAGLFQHDGLSWQVLGPQFERADALTSQSLLIDKTLKSWMASMSAKERHDFVQTIFGVLDQTKAQTLTQLNANKLALMHAMRSIDRDSRDKLLKTLKLLFGESTKTIAGTMFSQKRSDQ